MSARDNTLSLYSETKYRVEECCKCGVQFAMTMATYNHYRKHCKASGWATDSFYCPHGHEQHYTGREQGGVCPHCSRSFKQVRAHIANVHPEYVKGKRTRERNFEDSA